MRNQIPEQPQFFAMLAQAFPKIPPHFIARIGLGLIGAARRQQRIAVALCNGWIDQETYDRRRARIEKLMRVLLLELKPRGKGIGFITGGDPRGAAVKLVLPSGMTNDFGGEGFCVPEGE